MSAVTVNLEKCTVLLMDVAGTTTSISYIKDTVFAFTSTHAEAFLKEKWEEDSIKGAVKQLKDEPLDVEQATKLVIELTDKNDTNPGLKTIQGAIAEQGYKNGELKAHIYPDVPAFLEMWKKTRKVAVYSTGSVDHQKMLFSHTTEGDLTANIDVYFDQSVGPKTDVNSYKTIAEKLKINANEIAFITDDIDEAKAAKSAEFTAVLIKREDNILIPEDVKDLPVVTTFADILFDNPQKRKKDEEPAATVEDQPPSKVAKTDPEETPSTEDVKKTEGMDVEESVAATETPADKAEKPIEKTEEDLKQCEKTDTEDKQEKTEIITDDSKTADESEEIKAADDENKSEAKVEEVKKDETDDCNKEGTTVEGEKVAEEGVADVKEEESSNDAEKKMENEENPEEKTNKEKENNSEFANGVETSPEQVVNGEQTTREATDNSDASIDFKVKKVEEATTSDTAPPLSVEV